MLNKIKLWTFVYETNIEPNDIIYVLRLKKSERETLKIWR